MSGYWGWQPGAFGPGTGLLHASGYFRGCHFRLDSYETSTGRRGDISEYPLRNTPGGQDLGRKARRFNFAAYVMGPTWQLQRDQLLNACEADGPGLLVHPFHGEHVVLCESCSVSEGRQGGQRFATFTLGFVEWGGTTTPEYEADPGQSLLSSVGSGYPVMQGAFSG